MHIAQIDVAVRSNQPRRGRVILMAGLTAREIFPPCHYFATTKLWENESCHLGRNEMAGLKGKSGAFRQHEPLQARPEIFCINSSRVISPFSITSFASASVLSKA